MGIKAYSEKDNIQYANQNKLQLVAKVNPTITQGTRKKEEEFEYNKVAGMYVCKAGHMAICIVRTGKKGINKNQKDTYMFDIKKCKMGVKKKERKVIQNSDDFKEKSKERYKIEAKNSELHHRHGYDVASSLQGAMAIFSINLRRIITLMEESR